MPVKHSLVGVLHEQGRLCRILMKSDVVRAEGMPQDIAEFAEPCLLEGLLLLPLVGRPADFLVMAHSIGRPNPCPQVLMEPL